MNSLDVNVFNRLMLPLCLTVSLVSSLVLSANQVYAQEPVQSDGVRSPEDYLRRPVGTDFKLADWPTVSDYYRQLADQSENVLLREVGKTTEGREFLIAIISSKTNLENLDEIKKQTSIVADPRNRSDEEKQWAINEGKVVLFVTPTMHATEAAATEMGMQFAWQLATSEEEPFRSARENIVVVITPSLNPDGVDHVVQWYREHVFTPFEGTSMTKLYQYYTGHDNNRDWFMLTQAETRHLTGLMYQEWFPQILWDVHRQGNSRERFFVPPYRDPLNPNLDPGIVAGINVLGTRAVMDMQREGLNGIATGVSYDNWWNGGNRSVPARHNTIGILTEAASVKIASPVFQEETVLGDPLGQKKYQPSNSFIQPWPGGWWRLNDIVKYELSFGRSLLASINREPEFWLRNAMEAAERSIASGKAGGPRAWLITIENRDLHAVRRLADILMASGVEVSKAEAEFMADGRTYPPGTLIIWRDQPYGNYVKDLFELQKFPEGSAPYDVSGWTIPLLMGVHRVTVNHDFQANVSLLSNSGASTTEFPGDKRLADPSASNALSSLDSGSWTKLINSLQAGIEHRFVVKGASVGLILPGAELEEDTLPIRSVPRIGVYAPWTGSMDEGWLRWVLDEFEIPFQTLRNETIRAGRLEDLVDVIIIPDVTKVQLNHGRKPEPSPPQFNEGLEPEGAIALERFVRQGGRVIAFDDASNWMIDLLQLPLVDVTEEKSAKEFSCPGSVLRGVFEEHPFTAGLPPDIAVYFAKSTAWRVKNKEELKDVELKPEAVTTLLKYAPTRVLYSGYIAKEEIIHDQMAWAVCPYGEGDVHLFGFRPHYRAWSQATFSLLFRSLFVTTDRN